MAKKVAQATEVIQARIVHADHVLGGIPSERQLAEELGMSRTTVRQAVQDLVESGVLVRRPNGRLAVAKTPVQARTKSIAFVSPAYLSLDWELWREGVQAALEGRSVTLRPITYAHWGDPALNEALNGFDGMFLVPPAEKIPGWLTAKLNDTSCRVVVLDQDETEAGLPSVVLFPPEAEVKLFDHLAGLGHKRIDCLNTQVEDAVIRARIATWRHYLDRHGLAGQARTLAVKRPIESGYQVIRDVLREGRPLASALFCTTGPAAIGAMRAAHEAGLEIGKDISICAVNDEGVGRYLLKSMTALEAPPRARYLLPAVEWMLGDGPWHGPLLIQPADVTLFSGESTGPAPALPVIMARKPLL